MAAEDKRSTFPRLPTTLWDARPTLFVVQIAAGLFDTGTGAKTISNLHRGTRVYDVKVGIVTALVGTAWTFSVQTFDGTTTTTLADGIVSTAVATTRAPATTATNPPSVLVAGATTNTLIINATTATTVTTTPAFYVLLTMARELP